MGQCFIINAAGMTKESKEAVIKHGIDEAFDTLSGEQLQSLGTMWDLCESKATTSSSTVTTTVSDGVADTKRYGDYECVSASDPHPIFTHPVIDIELIGKTMPPGLASTGMLKPHGYFFVKRGGESSGGEADWSGYPRSVPVYAPITSWLRTVHPYRSGAYGNQAPEPPIEYMLIFEVSCEVYYKLDHLAPLPDVIKEAGPFPMGESTQLNTPLKIEGGELVSYWSGVNPGGNVDLGVYNTTIERTYANQSRYADGWHDAWLNEDCPFDYFPEKLRKKYYELFYDMNAGTIAGPQDCRTSAQSDILGTVQGAWFEPGKYGSVFAISTSMSGLVLATFEAHAETGASFAIKVPPEDATYIDPSKITSKHCYQTHEAYSGNMPPMYINLDLVSPTALQVEYGTGICNERTPVETLSLER